MRTTFLPAGFALALATLASLLLLLGWPPCAQAAAPVATDAAAALGLDFPSRYTFGDSAVFGSTIVLSGHNRHTWPILRRGGDGRDAASGALADRGDRHGCVEFHRGGGRRAVFCTQGADEGECVLVNGTCRKYPKELYLLGPAGGFPGYDQALAAARGWGVEMPYDRGRDVAAADFDGDGRDDLAIANDAPSEVLGPGRAVNRLFRNLGGRFREVEDTPVRRESRSGCVVAGDIDGAGGPDLLYCAAGGVLTYLNGGGTFRDASAGTAYRAVAARAIALARVDDDARPDLVLVAVLQVTVRLNRDGRFPAVDFGYPLQDGRGVAVGDGDGDVYVVQGWNSEYADLVLLNDGGASFRIVPVPRAATGKGDAAIAIPNGSGPGRAAFLVTNGLRRHPGPVQFISPDPEPAPAAGSAAAGESGYGASGGGWAGGHADARRRGRRADGLMGNQGGFTAAPPARSGPGPLRVQRHLGAFTRWKEHDAYSEALERLLRDLKVEIAGPSSAA